MEPLEGLSGGEEPKPGEGPGSGAGTGPRSLSSPGDGPGPGSKTEYRRWTEMRRSGPMPLPAGKAGAIKKKLKK